MAQIVTAGHEIISGTIGMNKSYWVLYKIVMSMLHGRPCCYIDPKGDTYLHLLTFFASTTQGQQLWDALSDRIILVNPISPAQHLVGFHALFSYIRRQSGFELADANRLQNVMAAAVGLLAERARAR